MARPSPAPPADTLPSAVPPGASRQETREEADRPPGAESPNQTDEMRSGGARPPAPGDDGEPPDNRTGLRRPAGGTPNVPRP
jgi:hypothetical protein